MVRAKEVVRSCTEVKQVAGCDSRRITVIVFSSISRNTYPQSATIRRGTTCDRVSWRGQYTIAEKANLRLPVWCQIQRRSKVRNGTCHRSTIIAPGEVKIRSNPLPPLKLILNLRSLFQVLIVVDAENTRR